MSVQLLAMNCSYNDDTIDESNPRPTHFLSAGHTTWNALHLSVRKHSLTSDEFSLE